MFHNDTAAEGRLIYIKNYYQEFYIGRDLWEQLTIFLKINKFLKVNSEKGTL